MSLGLPSPDFSCTATILASAAAAHPPRNGSVCLPLTLRVGANYPEGRNPAGTDPIKAFILKGFGIVREQAETMVCGIKTILMPGISAFIGGDIVSGLYTLGFKEKKEIAMLIDLGTNAEMVIGNCDKMLALSAAAGPAFDQKVYGSQLIKAVAQILREEKADRTGCLADEYFELGCIAGRTLVKQEEIRELQKAKAAVAAGITLLAREYGVSFTQIDKVYIAGGLGFYLDLDAAVEIGLFPKEFAGKMEAVGNTSLEGAYRYAMALQQGESEELQMEVATKPERELKELLSRVQELNLAELEGFEETYINAMNF